MSAQVSYPTAHPMRRSVLACAALGLLAACQTPLDFDMRGNFGNAPSTASAVQNITADRPRPDNRGVISYPGYQVAIAQRGDTIVEVATRVGADPQALARFNGLELGDKLRGGEVIALPTRVAESGAPASSTVDIQSMAGQALDRTQAANAGASAAPAPVAEPVRHKVARGETAYTIARLYNVSVRSLAEWNGLGADLSVREGQYLLIPTSVAAKEVATSRLAAAAPAAPGVGSATPVPPSAAKPLPRNETPATAAAKPAQSVAPDLGKTQTITGGKLAMPLDGTIIREYVKGKSDGIDIKGAAGAVVRAADAGTVAAITQDADQTPIIVIRHADNLLTVYANVDNITVRKGANVARGQSIAKLRSGDANFLHFEVRKGFDSVDPMPYLR